MAGQFLLVVLLLLSTVQGFEDSPSYQILKALFGNDSYKISRNVLPLTQPNNTPVVITLQFSLHQILDLDEKNEVIKLNLWVKASWNNPYLRWDAEKFGGVKSMIIETTKAWTPDLTLWNRAVEQPSLYERMEKRIRIKNDGSALWKSLVTTTSSCTIAVKHFPFDQQSCVLRFGSWHYPSTELKFSLNNNSCINLSYFSGSREWQVRGTSSKIVPEMFRNDGYYDVVYCSLTVHRNAMFYIVNMILPCATICLLGCLTFFLPPCNGERVSVVITVLLATTVYMLIVADFMPAAANEIPLVEQYYLVCIIETALCLVGTCLVVRWNETTGPMPSWIYVVFNCYLPKILFIKHERSTTAASKEFSNENGKSRKSIAEAAVPVFGNLENKNIKMKPKPEADWQLAAKSLNKFFLFFFIALFLATAIAIFKHF